MPIFRRAAAVAGAALVISAAGPALAWDAPNDPDFAKQYGPQQLGAPDAWGKSTGKGVTVAVVDSGVDLQHPEFKDKLVLVPGADTADKDDNPDDDSPLKDGEGKFIKGHGTAGAGVIAAVTNNGAGIAGMAPDAKIMPIKMFPSKGGSLSFTGAPEAIRLAVNHGAKVINLSVGTFSADGSLIGFIETPCLEAYQRGSLCVVSSGNARARNPSSGYARDVNALIVTANDAEGKPASFAQNADTKWSISAPGVQVYTTTTREQGDYTSVNGTSFSAPHASGAAALLFAQGLNVQQVVQKLLDTATPMGEPGRNGAGRVDAAAATGAPRTAAPEAAAEPGRTGGGGGVLLPRAATRTTVAPGAGRTAPVTAAPGQAQPAGGDAPAQADAPTSAANDPDFAGDLISGEGDTAIGAGGPEDDEDVGQMLFYTLVAIASIMTLGTGLSTLARVRRRFSRST